jgi:hypothetical protein
MNNDEARGGIRRMPRILAVVAGIMLTAGGAAAQSPDVSLYESFEGGFDEEDTNNTSDDWFFDYYEIEDDIRQPSVEPGQAIDFEYEINDLFDEEDRLSE